MQLAIRTILVPTDFSGPSRRALEYAQEIAARFGAGLRVLHVVETPRPVGSELDVPEVTSVGGRALADARQRLADTLKSIAGDEIIGQVLMGNAARQIVQYATDHEVDLVVMGTHGREGLAHLFMGSVAERVVRTAPCPVLTVREAEATAWRDATHAAAKAS